MFKLLHVGLRGVLEGVCVMGVLLNHNWGNGGWGYFKIIYYNFTTSEISQEFEIRLK